MDRIVRKKPVWLYWDRCLDQAPDLVRLCVDSWRRKNRDWSVCVLDEATLPNWVDMRDVRQKNPKITIPAFADVLRWHLMAVYGRMRRCIVTGR